MLSLLTTLAMASVPLNPDFELGDIGWTEGDTLGSSAEVVDDAAIPGLTAPSGTAVMRLTTGTFESFSTAVSSSDAFVVSRPSLSYQLRTDPQGGEFRVRVDAFTGSLSFLEDPAPSLGQFRERTGDLTPFCGMFIQLEPTYEPDNSVVVAYLDAIETTGVCPGYTDSDGDTWCENGRDLDGDGTCTAVGEASAVGFDGDCDETNPLIHPEADDIPGDGIDQDCSGADFIPLCFADTDGDGFGDPDVAVEGPIDCDGPGISGNSLDCDDTNTNSFPGAMERCDGADNDCDGDIDPAPPMDVWTDADGDGFGDEEGVSISVCGAFPGAATSDSDCDDGNAFVFPGANEFVDNGLDDDCDGFEACPEDRDFDGIAGSVVDGDVGCAGSPLLTGDCDDDRPDVFPGATELCDDRDNDCDGDVDEDTGAILYFEDIDGDGFGDDATGVSSCEPLNDRVEVGGDCDDSDADIRPGALEVRGNGVDEDCDGFEACFTDQDGDGFGGEGLEFVADLTCTGLFTANEDCNDNDATIFPGAEEVVANGVDEDCDGEDEAIPPRSFDYEGADCSSVPTSLGWLAIAGLMARRRR